MKVTLNFNDHTCKVSADGNDPIFGESGWSNCGPESRFLYHVKKELQKQGYDVIKKRMYKDGHLVNDLQQYIITRDRKKGFCIYNQNWAIQDAGEKFNDYNEVYLALVTY